ncbi:hypothetical protein MRX96_002253 [Rhipicephalus microplus]
MMFSFSQILPNDLRLPCIDLSRRVEAVGRVANVAGLVRLDPRREEERCRQGIVMRSWNDATGVSMLISERGILGRRGALFELDHLYLEFGLIGFCLVEFAPKAFHFLLVLLYEADLQRRVCVNVENFFLGLQLDVYGALATLESVVSVGVAEL